MGAGFGGCVACGCPSPQLQRPLWSSIRCQELGSLRSGIMLAAPSAAGRAPCLPRPLTEGGSSGNPAVEPFGVAAPLQAVAKKTRDVIVLTIHWHRHLRLPAGSPSARTPGARGPGAGLAPCPGRSVPGLSPVLGGQRRCRRWGWQKGLKDGLGDPSGTSCALGRAEGDPGATLPADAIPPAEGRGPWEPCPRAVPVAAPTVTACH